MQKPIYTDLDYVQKQTIKVMDIKLSVMELAQIELSSLFLSLGFLLLLPIIVIIKRGYKPKTSLNLPPGPWKLPIIGSLHHLFTAKMPHYALRRLAQQHGPVMLLRLGQVDALVVSSREAASEIMKTQDLNFCSRVEIPIAKVVTYGCTDIIFAPYGNYWRQLKKICIVELLNPKRVRSFHSIFEKEVSKLITDIHYTLSSNGFGKKPISLSAMVREMMNSIIASCAFGRRKPERQQEFITVVEEMLELMSGISVVDMFPHIKYIDVLSGTRSRINRIHRRLDDILGGIIEQHRLEKAEETEDTVDVLLGIKDRDELEFKLTDDNLKAVILDLFAAGSETSSTVVEWAMSELIKNPEAMEMATEEARRVLKGKTRIEDSDLGELHYLNMVIKETFRLHPPVPLIQKKSIDAAKLNGYNIPAGMSIFVNVWALGRDPQYWVDAESFRPERFSVSSVDFKGANFEFLPFGAGRRICPGMTFATATLGLTLAQLLRRFNWELPKGMMPEELDMTETFGLTAARKTELCLVATPYSPSVV